MMTQDNLEYLSHQVRISLDTFDKELLLQELNETLSFIERIRSVEIPDSTPLFEHPLVSHVSLRSDDSIPELLSNMNVAKILQNAPQTNNDSIVVPKVI